MCYIIDCIFDFAVSISYHINDWGTIGNRKMFVEDYCNEHKIIDKGCKKAIKKYSKYYIKNIQWTPSREEVEDWFTYIYKK